MHVVLLPYMLTIVEDLFLTLLHSMMVDLVMKLQVPAEFNDKLASDTATHYFVSIPVILKKHKFCVIIFKI